MSTNKKTEIIRIRLTAQELGAARARAHKVAKGSLSKWVRHCLKNCPMPSKPLK